MTCTECQPEQETATNNIVGYYIPPKPKNNEGLFVPRKEYFEHGGNDDRS